MNQVKFEYVLSDNWFGAKDNMEFIHNDLKKKFIIGMKANRLVALSDEERKKGQYQNLSTLNIKDGEARKAWLKDLSLLEDTDDEITDITTDGRRLLKELLSEVETP